MSDNNSEMANRLIAERKAVEKIYQAFSLHDPDLMDEAVTQDWKDIPLAPGQASGPEGLKPIIRGFIEAFPDVKSPSTTFFRPGEDCRARRNYRYPSRQLYGHRTDRQICQHPAA